MTELGMMVTIWWRDPGTPASISSETLAVTQKFPRFPYSHSHYPKVFETKYHQVPMVILGCKPEKSFFCNQSGLSSTWTCTWCNLNWVAWMHRSAHESRRVQDVNAPPIPMYVMLASTFLGTSPATSPGRARTTYPTHQPLGVDALMAERTCRRWAIPL